MLLIRSPFIIRNSVIVGSFYYSYVLNNLQKLKTVRIKEVNWKQNLTLNFTNAPILISSEINSFFFFFWKSFECNLNIDSIMNETWYLSYSKDEIYLNSYYLGEITLSEYYLIKDENEIKNHLEQFPEITPFEEYPIRFTIPLRYLDSVRFSAQIFNHCEEDEDIYILMKEVIKAKKRHWTIQHLSEFLYIDKI